MRRLLEWGCHSLAGFVLTVWMMMGISYSNPHHGLWVQMAGTADRPFIYRVLVPLAIKALMLLTGVPVVPALVAVQLVALTCFSKAVWELAGMVRHQGWAWIVITLGVIPLCIYYRHIYDGPTMALWAVALLALYRRQWTLMLGAYLLACASKETALLLIPIVALVEWDGRRLGLMAVIYAVVRLPILWYFRGNAGTPLELHLADQVACYPYYIAGALAVGALLGWRWEDQPVAFRRTLLIFPVFVFLFMIGGFPRELRVFGEIWPILGLTLFNAFSSWRTHENKSRVHLVSGWGGYRDADAAGAD